MSRNARERIAKLIEAIAPQHTDQILREIFSEVVAGATVEEMSHAMRCIRAEQAKPTYAAMGEHIWQLRYDRASEEAERNEADPGNDTTLAYKLGKQSWHLDWMDGERSGDDDG